MKYCVKLGSYYASHTAKFEKLEDAATFCEAFDKAVNHDELELVITLEHDAPAEETEGTEEIEA
jgi:hypothetical protein